jgi:endonuclease III
MPDDDTRSALRRVADALDAQYGRKRNARDLGVLDTLVETILSQQNTSESARSVFGELKRRFPTWAAADAASVDEIEDAIRSGGLARMKAARIKAILAAIERDHGSFDLDFLCDRVPDEAMRYLTEFPGVGPKTARCTLLFACGSGVFPMDVHIFRILIRLGLLDPRAPDEDAHRRVEAIVPRGRHYGLHVNLIAHGRTVCRPSNPLCDDCCIVDYCPFGQERLLEPTEDDPRLARGSRRRAAGERRGILGS